MNNTLLATTFADLEGSLMLALKLGLCFAIYLLVAWPSGRAIMEHTGERAVRNVWHAAIGFLALVLFVGMSGVGEVYEAGFKRAAQDEQSRNADQDASASEADVDAPSTTTRESDQRSSQRQGS